MRFGWRDIYSKRGLLSISSSRSQGVPTTAPSCKLVGDASDWLRVPHSTAVFCLCLNLTAWFSSRRILSVTHLLYPSTLIALLFTNQNTTACQSTRGHLEGTENPCHMLYNSMTTSTLQPHFQSESLLRQIVIVISFARKRKLHQMTMYLNLKDSNSAKPYQTE